MTSGLATEIAEDSGAMHPRAGGHGASRPSHGRRSGAPRSAGRTGFTLLEVVATLLLVVLGLAAVLGMARLGLRWSGAAISAATGLSTALTVVSDARPGGRTADMSDGDGDRWGLVSGSLAIPATGSYAFTTAGIVNGYYVRRVETSSDTDVMHGTARYADVTVDVFWGVEGQHVTGLKQRIVRRR